MTTEEEMKSNPPEETEDPSHDLPIDFTTFVLSLRSTTAFHLGLSPHPDNDNCCENLPMAKQTIDILVMLQDKTTGNLTGEEERMIAESIYNLRMAYVEVAAKCGC